MCGHYPHKHIAEGVKEFMKITKMEANEAQKAIDETPKRVVGQWKQLLAELKKTGQGAKIVDITRGQVAALIRQCKEDGFGAVAVDKYTGVIISPPKIKK